MKFRKKPVVIEAVQWTGSNRDEMLVHMPGKLWSYNPLDVSGAARIETLEGIMSALPGDWVIRGVGGEYYPCKPDIFEKTYEAVSE